MYYGIGKRWEIHIWNWKFGGDPKSKTPHRYICFVVVEYYCGQLKTFYI